MTIGVDEELFDRLVTMDLPRRGVIGTIYSLARAHHGRPLVASAAELLMDRLGSGQAVLIATGWPDRPHVNTGIAESDGPPGAAALARALHLGLGAVPILMVEAQLVEPMEAILHAAGLRCLTPSQAILAATSSAPLHAAAVVSLSTDSATALAMAEDLCSTYDVGAFIAVEKGGENDRGRIHTSRGADTTDPIGKADRVLEVCRDRGIATIGIGDGGNEIGMGNIQSELSAKLTFGSECGCGCGGGVVPAGVTDVLVAATVSNWGANAVAAALAARLGRPEILHSEDIECALLEASARSGLIDGVLGLVGPSADGLGLDTHRAVLRLLHTIVGVGVDASAWAQNASMED
jgi:D-glutamate cyclase